jgi:hypothetical protein
MMPGVNVFYLFLRLSDEVVVLLPVVVLLDPVGPGLLGSSPEVGAVVVLHFALHFRGFLAPNICLILAAARRIERTCSRCFHFIY